LFDIDAVLDYLPSPLDVPSIKGIKMNSDEEVERKCSDTEPFSGLAFKVMTDPFVGSLTFVRIYSGSLTTGTTVINTVKDKKERIGRMLLMHANNREDIKEARAGDIIALAGLKDTTTGDTLSDQNNLVILEKMEFPKPVIEVAVEPKTKADQEKMGMALARLAAEDPSLYVSTDEESGQTVLKGMGELHLEIIIDRMKREFKVEANIADLKQQANERSTELIDLLNSAERYLALPANQTTCPLCGTSVLAEELRGRIQVQLEQLTTTRALLQTFKEAQSRLKTATDECGRINGELHQIAIERAACFVANEPAVVKPLGIDWPAQHLVMTSSVTGDPTSSRIATLAEQLISLDIDIEQERDRLQTRLTAYNNVKMQHDLLTDSTDKVSMLTTLFERLEKVYNLVVTKRHEFVQTVLDEIIDEVNALYEAIHPGEKIGLHRLEIDESKRSSLEQHAHFEDEQGVVPQAYFSESHLDTFGFCLWLALAKRGNSKQLVLVLDDVFTSVDAQHFRRISELLESEALHFQQIIIATHNRLWHDYYKTSRASAHLLKLERWTITHGLRPYEDLTLVNELATALIADQFDRQVVASKAGVLLENILDSLAAYYECNLKYKPGRSYTLGELLRTTKKLFQEAKIKRVKRDRNGQPIMPHQPENWIEIVLKDYHEKLDGIKLIRNEVGAHFNPSGNDWSDNDVREFGQAAYDLAEALACPQCGHIPKNVRSDHRGCSCDAKYQTRLYPMNLN
ncbi:MAG: hypothetical protein EOO88_34110, partial [Pedobacter sp.]